MRKNTKKLLIEEIIDNGVFKVTNTTQKDRWILLKNGSRAPIFLDTSVFISYPILLKKVNRYALNIIKKRKIKFDKIIGLNHGLKPTGTAEGKIVSNCFWIVNLQTLFYAGGQ